MVTKIMAIELEMHNLNLVVKRKLPNRKIKPNYVQLYTYTSYTVHIVYLAVILIWWFGDFLLVCQI